jgi:hypothetical protein
MADMKAYWRSRRTLESQLEECTYVTSIEDPSKGWVDGSVCGADRETAARVLVEGSHRRSTQEEISKFHSDEQARTALCKSMSDVRGNKTVLTVDENLAAKLRLKSA